MYSSVVKSHCCLLAKLLYIQYIIEIPPFIMELSSVHAAEQKAFILYRFYTYYKVLCTIICCVPLTYISNELTHVKISCI